VPEHATHRSNTLRESVWTQGGVLFLDCLHPPFLATAKNSKRMQRHTHSSNVLSPAYAAWGHVLSPKADFIIENPSFSINTSKDERFFFVESFKFARSV